MRFTSMTLLLFHGTEIVLLFAGVGLGAVILLTLLIVIFTRPNRFPIIPASIYLVIALASCLSFLLDEYRSGTFLDDGYLLVLPVALCFPWSLMTVILATFYETNLGVFPFLLGASVNAVILYIVGRIFQARRSAPANTAEDIG